MLPKGQYDIGKMPRFGLSKFVNRFPKQTESVEIRISGKVEHPSTFNKEFAILSRTQLRADFHCVTTWSSRNQVWEGVLFEEFFNRLILPEVKPMNGADFIVLYGQDGYRACLPLRDLLSSNVILADCLNGQPLGIEHGAPLRLVASDHYGYKSVKYIHKIDFLMNGAGYRPAGLKFMEHPRARVAKEERGLVLPGWLLRYIYRPLVKPTIAKFERALASNVENPE